MSTFNINVYLARRTEEIRREAEESIERETKRVEQATLARMLLGGAGFPVKLPAHNHDWCVECFTLRVTKEQLPAVRQALGCPLKMDGKSIEDADQRLICITLEPTDFPHVRIEYLTQLPKPKRGKKGPKCKIVKVRQKASVSHSLVCDME